MSSKMTPSELLVANLAGHSFLSLWCYPNPRGKEHRKELCDCLVVCDPDVIIMSVKDCHLREGDDLAVSVRRWHRNAVEESVRQIYGAERHILSAQAIVDMNGQEALAFPPRDRIRMHRIAIAFGGGEKASKRFGDFGKGFVHVLDEVSLEILMRELDTVTDFTDYLAAKEAFMSSGGGILMSGEENLLAFYLSNERTFPKKCDKLCLEEDLWEYFRTRPEYRAKKKRDDLSRIWDDIIEEMGRDFRAGRLIGQQSLEEVESAMRSMARENRFCRRVLGKALLEFLDRARKEEVRSRCTTSPSGVVYVFLAAPTKDVREQRQAELLARCLVIRARYADAKTVVGIATDPPGLGGHSLDVVYTHIPELTKELTRKIQEIKTRYGYFENPAHRRTREDEYPTIQAAQSPITQDSHSLGRNTPCSCGSGRKYKKCCGRK